MELREEKRRKTRRRIEEAARQLFDEHGYDDTTVDMIAAAADVSPRTFYRYYETKASIVAEPGRRLIERVTDGVRPGLSILGLVEELAGAVDEALGEDDLEWSLHLQRQKPELVAEAPVWQRRWAEQLARGVARADGRDRPVLADRVKAATAVQLVGLVADELILRQPNTDCGTLLHQVTTALSENLDGTER